MGKRFSKLHVNMILWLMILAMTSLLQGGCSSEKRVTKALRESASKRMQATRAWPYNYTYAEYSDKLDDAKFKTDFYSKRYALARDAKNRGAQKTYGNNIKRYQELTQRLEADTEFFEIYELHVKSEEIRIKKERKETERLKMKDVRAYEKRRKKMKKKHKEQNKLREKQIKEQRQRIKERKKDLAKRNKERNKEIKQNEKDIKRFLKRMEKASEEDKEYYNQEIILLRENIDKINKELKQRLVVD